MNPVRSFAALALALAGALAHGQSMTPVIYPAKGQNAQQQDRDKYECYAWAREQSGFDPMQPAPQTAATTPVATTAVSPTGSLGGLGRSAAVGAAVGEVANNDAGRGAAVGVLGGAVMQTMKQRQAAQTKQQQQAAQQQTARNQQRSTFDRGFGACMEARGYAVK